VAKYLLSIGYEKEYSDSIERKIIEKVLHTREFIANKVEYITVEDLKGTGERYKEYTPVGDIDFITCWLHENYGVEKENPIEVPKYLRTDYFLKREYTIVQAKKLPRNGRYFIKNASRLKDFSYAGELSHLNIEECLNKHKSGYGSGIEIKGEDLFVISSILDYKSEYRVYVIDGKIENISNYNGDSNLFPDSELIRRAVELINSNEKYLKSYTIDIMVGDKGTAIIEVHNFASVGLYSTMWDSDLLYAFSQGIDYLINDNREIEL
jgi:hypothetical protein